MRTTTRPVFTPDFRLALRALIPRTLADHLYASYGVLTRNLHHRFGKFKLSQYLSRFHKARCLFLIFYSDEHLLTSYIYQIVYTTPFSVSTFISNFHHVSQTQSNYKSYQRRQKTQSKRINYFVLRPTKNRFFD